MDAPRRTHLGALFLAAVQAPADPDAFLPDVLAAPPDELGAAVVPTVLRVRDGPGRPAVPTLVRWAVTHEWSARLVRELVLARIIRRVVGTPDLPEAEREACCAWSRWRRRRPRRWWPRSPRPCSAT